MAQMSTKTFLILVFAVLIITGCSTNAQNNGAVNPVSSGGIERIEIYHFHGTNQCYSCITVGEYAEETVKTYFADELNSGKIVFDHINGELSENRDLVIKYRATGSSLWIGTYTKDGEFSAEQNINVWYKIGNKQNYMAYLRDVINKKIGRN